VRALYSSYMPQVLAQAETLVRKRTAARAFDQYVDELAFAILFVCSCDIVSLHQMVHSFALIANSSDRTSRAATSGGAGVVEDGRTVARWQPHRTLSGKYGFRGGEQNPQNET
jgi:hypothetical protein